MFTGIVEEMGRVRTRRDGYFEIEAGLVIEDAKVGDSIAVNGCCLTVIELGPGWWAAQAVEESLGRTTLGRAEVGDQVNLERPVRPSDRLGGHIVQGHVDATGVVAQVSPALRVTVPSNLARYVVEKGSIALDGVSLTVVGVSGDTLEVAIIPHTAESTTLGRKLMGDHVNLEVDIMAKYAERLLSAVALNREA
ncbi:MAG: riboflavin synthase [Acidimicrobiales bacterium]